MNNQETSPEIRELLWLVNFYERHHNEAEARKVREALSRAVAHSNRGTRSNKPNSFNGRKAS